VLARGNFTNGVLVATARQHDLAATRVFMRDLGWQRIPFNANTNGFRFWYDLERQDWRDFLLIEPMMQRLIVSAAGTPLYRARINAFNNSRPNLAIAHAQLGEFRQAEMLVAPLPPDHDPGVRARAIIADLKGDYARADWWFARSGAQTPSLPLTDLWWGQALLRRGQPDAAIIKFTLANQKGPQFADPLEGWGEALMAKNQSHRALAKFAEAEKYAPNWGRLHLKWGEALVYAGKKDEGAKHFARAAALDLTASEKQELARHK
jgi:tetratricopeptide (TPR) repeat protein